MLKDSLLYQLCNKQYRWKMFILQATALTGSLPLPAPTWHQRTARQTGPAWSMAAGRPAANARMMVINWLLQRTLGKDDIHLFPLPGCQDYHDFCDRDANEDRCTNMNFMLGCVRSCGNCQGEPLGRSIKTNGAEGRSGLRFNDFTRIRKY